MGVVSRVEDAVTTAPFAVLLREDYERAGRRWDSPGYQGLVVYRIGRWARSGPQTLVTRLARIVHRVLNSVLVRGVYGMEISPDAVIGRRVLIGHHQAVQIPAHCVIGDGTVLRHNVTIGFGQNHRAPFDVPHLGRDVRLGSGCCLLGPIRVGHGARIGPNCVVISDVPDGATVVAPPPRVFQASEHAPVGRRPQEVPDRAVPDVCAARARP